MVVRINVNSMASRESSKFHIDGCQVQSGRHSEKTDNDCRVSVDPGSHVSGRLSTDARSKTSGEESDATVSDDMMSHVMAVNKNLVLQLDALRLRLEVDFKHGQEQRALMMKEADMKLEEKSKSAFNLKEEIQEKTKRMSRLTEDNDRKSKEIEDLQRLIDDLRDDVGTTKIYADELECEVSRLQKDKGKLQTGSAYQEKEEEIRGLHREIDFLRKNLTRMEKELLRAKEVIAQQGSKVRLMENENKNTLVKFKEELNKISLNMRLEIGKMREVMRSQWREMKDLREQNETMSKDIREIRDFLVQQSKSRTHQIPVREQPAEVLQKGSDHMINMAFKPSFPVRSKDKSSTKQNRV